MESLARPTLQSLRDARKQAIGEALARRELKREAAWTEALAVGDRAFAKRGATNTRNRSRFDYASISAGQDAWAVREGTAPHGVVSRPG
jgi:hypothetical protein